MQYMVRFYLFLFFVLFGFNSEAQITGTIYDKNGEVLPFVTIYKEGTSKGTVSNLDGDYSLQLDDGEHVIIYKYIGFGVKKEAIILKGSVSIDIVLKEELIEVEEVIISAETED